MILFLVVAALCASTAVAGALEALVGNMTLAEKCSLLVGSANVHGYTGYVNGNKRLNIPALRMNDGPQGYRGPKHTSTSWPCGLALAASFHPQLVYQVAKATGREFKLKGANVFLGPGMNLARNPTCGRNFEYLCGEDPLLGEVMATKYITGIQSNAGLMATAKHFVNNEQETKRNSINSVVSEDTNWNLYYRPFLASVRRANVASVMCSYNKINGEFACENSLILQRDLRTAMGFQGVVVSDWFATRSTLNSAKAGLDMEMPIPLFYGKAMERLVQHGDLDESVVNRKVEQVLATMDRFKVKHSVPEFHPKRNATSRAHYNLARLAAASSAVLLKNHDAILPIDASQVGRIVVLGDGGRDKVLYTGGGSGHVSPAYIVSPFDAVRHHAAASNPEIPVEYHSTDSALGLKQRFGRDVLVLVFVGTSSTEAKDRATLGFEPKQLALVEHTTRFLSDRVVVCATAPGAVLLPFYDTVQAVVLQFLAGQATGDGLADVLFGVVDPGGARLPVTMPNKDNEVEMSPEQFPGVDLVANYSEELLIGYRYYSRHSHVKPLLPFGFGMSYSKFTFLGVRHEHQWIRRELVVLVGLLHHRRHRALLPRTPKGVTVVQVYVIKYPDAAGLGLPHALLGFQRVELGHLEISTCRLRIALTGMPSPLAIYKHGKYRVFPGRYTLAVGDSSANFWKAFQVDLLL